MSLLAISTSVSFLAACGAPQQLFSQSQYTSLNTGLDGAQMALNGTVQAAAPVRLSMVK